MAAIMIEKMAVIIVTKFLKYRKQKTALCRFLFNVRSLHELAAEATRRLWDAAGQKLAIILLI